MCTYELVISETEVASACGAVTHQESVWAKDRITGNFQTVTLLCFDWSDCIKVKAWCEKFSYNEKALGVETWTDTQELFQLTKENE